jgi:hypothetical protein
MEVGHFQAKFTRPFLAHIVPPLAARKLETSKLQAYKLQLSLLRGCGSAELVEKVGKSDTGIVQ